MKTAALMICLVVALVSPAIGEAPQFFFWVYNTFPDGGSFISSAVCSLGLPETFSLCVLNPKELSLAAINDNGNRMRRSLPVSNEQWIVQIWSGIDVPLGKKFRVEAASYGSDQDWNFSVFDSIGNQILKRTFYGDDICDFDLEAVPIELDQWQSSYKAIVSMSPLSAAPTVPEPDSSITLFTGSILLLFGFIFGAKKK